MSQLNNPSQWTTGADPPTDKQKGFISTLASSKNLPVDDPSSLTKSEASAKINELKDAPAQNTDGPAADGPAADGPSAVGPPIQDPNTWTTGDEKATGKQMGYVAVMAKKAGESVPGEMGKTDASKKIEELKAKTGM